MCPIEASCFDIFPIINLVAKISILLVIENWEVLPVVTEGPYDFGSKKTLGIRERFKLISTPSSKAKETGIPVSEADSSSLYSGSESISDSQNPTKGN